GPARGGVAVLPILDDAAPWWRVVAADVVNLQYAPDLYRHRRRALRATFSTPAVVTVHTLLDATLGSRAAALWLPPSARHVAAAVTWTGRRTDEDVSRILAAADVFVAPFDGGASIRRGSLMAGLAHGLPVVSTSPAAPSAYLRDADNVALVPPRDAAALAARLAALLASSAERARLAQGARKLAARV